VCLAFAPLARGDDAWRPVLTQDGVAVSERDVPGRALPEFRGETEIPADLYDVLAVILDVPAQTEWMWQCRESRVLASDADGHSRFYQRLDVHWPASDRDVVLRGETLIVEPGRRARSHFWAVDDPSVPPVDGLVRMSELDGSFELEALAAGGTRVTYTVSADAAGSLPHALIRGTVKESPYDTLTGLRRRVAETRGRYAEVAARWRARR
jgi:hypothetical protein